MFAKTQNTVSMILGVALVAATTFAPAFAGEAALSPNEHAAQSAIIATADRAPASVDASAATLARNESLAERAIVDVAPSAPVGVNAIDEATLTQNEVAAQRAIDVATASNNALRHSAGATASVASTRSPAQR